MSSDKTIAKQYANAAAVRESVLVRVRDAAVLTIASVLPQEHRTDMNDTERAFQSLGAMGVENLVGRMLLALFPPGTPWFRFTLAPATLANRQNDPKDINVVENFLYARELQIQSQLDATNYRAQYRTMLEQLMVGGNMLGMMQENYEVRPFRMDNWVQKRAADGQILWLITCEVIDPELIDPKVLERAALKPSEIDRGTQFAQVQHNQVNDRHRLFTRAARQRNGDWVIEQELNQRIVNTSVETVASPFLPAGYIESPGEDWSRSFVDRRMGDLRSLNGLTLAVNDMAAATARLVPVFDPTKGWEASDLAQPNGKVISGRVNGNMPDGIGFLRSEKAQDINSLRGQVQDIQQRLGRAMLLETASQPSGDRVTATQIMRIAQELEGGTGGVFAKIAAEVQIPLLARTSHQMEKDKILDPLPDVLKGQTEVRILTGLEALGRQLELDKLIGGVQLLSQIPGALDRLNLDVVADRILRAMSINTDGILKTPEQIEADFNQAAQQAALAQGASTAIDTLGKVVQERAKQQPTEVRVA